MDTFFTVGIASCSHHAVSGTSSQTLSSEITVMFIPYLQQEGKCCPFFIFSCGSGHIALVCLKYFPDFSVHEGTLVHAVSVLSQWSSRLTVEVPSALMDWLKKAFTLKTSTSLVRHAYLQTMLGAFKGTSHRESTFRHAVPAAGVKLTSPVFR